MVNYGKLLLKLGMQFNRNQKANNENQELESEKDNPNIILIAENEPKRLNFKTKFDNNFKKTKKWK